MKNQFSIFSFALMLSLFQINQASKNDLSLTKAEAQQQVDMLKPILTMHAHVIHRLFPSFPGAEKAPTDDMGNELGTWRSAYLYGEFPRKKIKSYDREDITELETLNVLEKLARAELALQTLHHGNNEKMKQLLTRRKETLTKNINNLIVTASSPAYLELVRNTSSGPIKKAYARYITIVLRHAEQTKTFIMNPELFALPCYLVKPIARPRLCAKKLRFQIESFSDDLDLIKYQHLIMIAHEAERFLMKTWYTGFPSLRALAGNEVMYAALTNIQ